MNKHWTRFLSALLSLAMLLSCSAFAEAAEEAQEAPGATTVEGRTYPCLYFRNNTVYEPETSDFNIYSVNSGDIPYVALSEFLPFLSGFLETQGRGAIQYDIEAIGEGEEAVYFVTRPDNGSGLIVHPGNDTLTFDNFNTFTISVGSRALVTAMDMPEEDETNMVDYYRLVNDILSLSDEEKAAFNQFMAEYTPEEESEAEAEAEAEEEAEEEAPAADPTPKFFGMKEGSYLNRAGSVLTLNLADYDIDIVSVDGECYLPFQTLVDLLVNGTYYKLIFDEEYVILCLSDKDLTDLYATAPKHAMSEEFARFNYNELCFLLDCKYGLKSEHHITDFHSFMAFSTNLMDMMLDPDAISQDAAIARLTGMYMDDKHSGYSRGSYLYKESYKLSQLMRGTNLGPSTNRYFDTSEVFADARKAVYRAWVPGYEEVGDTAFITFDQFTYDRRTYYDVEGEEPIDRDNPQDTVDLIIYANRQIKREGSPIKNIVIDLSNNIGGAGAAAIVVMSWFVGEATMALRDTFTGAETDATYLVDVDLDGAFTEGDNVATGYNLYCLMCDNSFSCGNLLPAAFRESGKVTLVGQTSGGGSCVVQPCTTAAGTTFQISGTQQVSILKNGTFYNTDAGIEPDVVLTKPESFYDRAGLMEYLKALK